MTVTKSSRSRRSRLLLTALALAGAAALAQGQAFKTIEVEWEEVPKVGGYEVRLIPTGGGKTLKFLTVESRLIQEIPVGEYKMQIRSRARDEDYMSPWSEMIPLEVVAKEITPVKPEDKATINAVGIQKYTVEFEWEPVNKVKEYTLRVWSEKRADKPWVFVTRNTKKKLDVPPGEVYYWQVLFESASAVSYQQAPTTFTFTILGQKLTTPEIIPPEPAPGLKKLTWRESDGATTYIAKLFYRHLDEKEWRMTNQTQTSNNEWNFTGFKPGAYRLDVIATAVRRTQSDLAQYEFFVKPSDVELKQALK